MADCVVDMSLRSDERDKALWAEIEVRAKAEGMTDSEKVFAFRLARDAEPHIARYVPNAKWEAQHG